MKKIGLLGGISYNTTIQHYDLIMKKYNRIFNDINYPEIVIYSLSHGRFKSYENSGDLANYIDYIMYGAKYLEAAGAELIAFAANSPHQVIEQVRGNLHVPVISSLDSAVKGARSLNKKGDYCWVSNLPCNQHSSRNVLKLITSNCWYQPKTSRT